MFVVVESEQAGSHWAAPQSDQAIATVVNMGDFSTQCWVCPRVEAKGIVFPATSVRGGKNRIKDSGVKQSTFTFWTVRGPAVIRLSVLRGKVMVFYSLSRHTRRKKSHLESVVRVLAVLALEQKT